PSIPSHSPSPPPPKHSPRSLPAPRARSTAPRAGPTSPGSSLPRRGGSIGARSRFTHLGDRRAALLAKDRVAVVPRSALRAAGSVARGDHRLLLRGGTPELSRDRFLCQFFRSFAERAPLFVDRAHRLLRLAAIARDDRQIVLFADAADALLVFDVL